MNLLRLYAPILAALALASASAAHAATPLPEADQQCLACHGQPGLEKVFATGEKVALHVEGDAYSKSVHAGFGCAACHADVDVAKHPAKSRSYVRPRDLSLTVAKACRNCHEVSYEAHAKSVHARSQERNAAAPLCVTCHGTHDIVRASVAIRDACLGCHADAPAAHDKWLPNTRQHFEVVACAACHAPEAGRRVELRFFDEAAKREPATSAKPANGDKPLDAADVRALVRQADLGAGRIVLAGRVEPASGGEGHRLFAKDHAVKECSTCHRKGADAFQNVSLSTLGPDGERARYETQKDVLHALTSIESVRGFYAMGGTRIQMLDIVLGLALVGGISAPLGHFVMRKIMRNVTRKEQDHE